VWGVLSDFIGRKITLLIVNIWILVFGILSAIKVAADDPAGKMVGYPWLLICRFGVGFGAGGTAQAVTYFSEFLPRKARGYCLVLIEFWWAIGSMFGALLALGVMNSIGWHWYLGIATFPLFFVLFLFPFVPESARFYVMKKKPQRAKSVLKRVAWFNRRPMLQFWWAIGSMFGALLALGVMNSIGWHWYLGIATFPLFFVLFLFPFVPESARFYVMKKKPQRAKSVLKRVAWFNRRPMLQFWWAIGSMFGALLALGVMNSIGWHWYLGIATFPLFFVLFLFPFVPESARFYVMKKKPQRAKSVLKRVAWFNRRPMLQGDVVSVEQQERNVEVSVSYSQEDGVGFRTSSVTTTVEEIPLLQEEEEHEHESKKSLQALLFQPMKKSVSMFLDMFTNGMWRTTLLLWILWIGCAWIYYGVVILTTSIFHGSNHCFSETQNTSNDTQCDELSNSSYLNIFWTSVAEVPGLVVTIIIIEVLGRKKTMALEFSLTMVGFLLLFICSTPIVTTLFLFITRAFATGVFQAVYVYTPEVYPTNIRASAMGFHTAAARVGALLTPFNAQVWCC
jgi:MFS family permease